MNKIAMIQALIDAWKRSDVSGVLDLLHLDIEYHYMVGARPLIGKDWVEKFLNRYSQDVSDIQWRINDYAESGNKIFVEAVDEYKTDAGVHVVMPYMGKFEFRDGLIWRWRDYGDPALVERAKLGEPTPDWLMTLAQQGGGV